MPDDDDDDALLECCSPWLKKQGWIARILEEKDYRYPDFYLFYFTLFLGFLAVERFSFLNYVAGPMTVKNNIAHHLDNLHVHFSSS